MPIVNGINTALTRPCTHCKKHIMWAEQIYRLREFGHNQLHRECLEKYRRYMEAEHALTGKERYAKT